MVTDGRDYARGHPSTGSGYWPAFLKGANNSGAARHSYPVTDDKSNTTLVSFFLLFFQNCHVLIFLNERFSQYQK